MKRIVAALTLLTVASAASANVPVLLAATSTGEVLRADTTTGQFSTLGFFSCTGITSMAVNGQELILGDSFGNVWRFQLPSQAFLGSFNVGAGINALVLDGQDLVITTTASQVLRVNAQTGAQSAPPRSLQQEAHAVAMAGTSIIAGGHSTFVFKGDRMTGAFQFLTACGGQVDSAATMNTTLLLGTTGGTVYRLDSDTGAYSGQFNLPEGETAIVIDGSTALAASATGAVRRFNPQTGAVLNTYTAGRPIEAMIIAPGIPCAGDFNHDDRLNVNDFVAFLNGYAARTPEADMNHDGLYNISDFIAFQNTYAAGCP